MTLFNHRLDFDIFVIDLILADLQLWWLTQNSYGTHRSDILPFRRFRFLLYPCLGNPAAPVDLGDPEPTPLFSEPEDDDNDVSTFRHENEFRFEYRWGRYRARNNKKSSLS